MVMRFGPSFAVLVTKADAEVTQTMAGPINTHNGLGLNGSKAGSLTPGGDKNNAEQADEQATAQTSKAASDEVSLSAAAKHLNTQDVTNAKEFKVETPEQAAAMAKQVATAIRQDGQGALNAQGSGDVSGLRGLLMSA